MGLPLDADQDGKISKDEVLKQFAKVDANGDGSITKEEIANHLRNRHSQPGSSKPADEKGGRGGAARGPAGVRPPHAPGGIRPTAESLLQRADRNHDGKLSKDELPEFLWSRLSAGDSDKDGSLSKSELEEFLKHQRPTHPSGKPTDPRNPDEKPAAPIEKPKEEGKAA